MGPLAPALIVSVLAPMFFGLVVFTRARLPMQRVVINSLLMGALAVGTVIVTLLLIAVVEIKVVEIPDWVSKIIIPFSVFCVFMVLIRKYGPTTEGDKHPVKTSNAQRLLDSLPVYIPVLLFYIIYKKANIPLGSTEYFVGGLITCFAMIGISWSLIKKGKNTWLMFYFSIFLIVVLVLNQF